MGTQSQVWQPGLTAVKFRRAVWLAMAAMTSFFLALSYGYLQLHPLAGSGGGGSWMPPALATILTINTAVLLASSAALVWARRRLRTRHPAEALRWTGVAAALGIAFLYGQAQGWRLLLAAGIYGSTYPSSGFFYLVTAVHAAHLAVALGLLLWVLSRLWRGRMPADRALLMDLTGLIWHCLDIIWVYLFIVLMANR